MNGDFVIDKAIDMVQKYAPKFYAKNPVGVIDTIMNNLEFAKCVVNFCLFAEEQEISKGEIRTTLIHDVTGLHNKDEFFLPRVDSYRDLIV